MERLRRLKAYIESTPEHVRYLKEQGPTHGLLQVFWDWARDHGYRYPWVASAAAEFSEEFGGAAFLGAAVALYNLEVRNGGHHQCLSNSAGLDAKGATPVFATMAELYGALGYGRTDSGKKTLALMRDFAKAARRGRLSFADAARLDARYFRETAWTAELEASLRGKIALDERRAPRASRGRGRRVDDRLNRWRDRAPLTRLRRAARLLEQEREAAARGDAARAGELRALALELVGP
jgi:hypothetical protein